MSAYRPRAWRGIAATILGMAPWPTPTALIGCLVGRYIASALI